MNKNKKGFTLVELIAVVAFIAIIILIATPNIINQIRKNKEVRYTNFVGDLCLAAEAYMNKNDLNEDLQEENDTVTISISDLISDGYIKSTLTNPKTNATITNDLLEVKLDSNENYDCTLLSGKVKVTFNPNGGTVSKRTKSVTVGQTYGTLPTPTKEGYTFKGWNGKNKFNKNAIPYKAYYYIKGDGTEVDYGEYSLYQINVEPNTTYTITNSGGSTAPGYVVYNSSGTRIAGENFTNRKTVTFTTPSTAKYIRFSVVTQTSSNRYDKEYFQLEEGDTATEYEPYKIESSTKVVQTSNHTLTAIWEENET